MRFLSGNSISFLPLDARDEFNVLTKFLSREEFTSDYLKEELELAERYLPPPDAETVRKLLLERAKLNDVQRAAAYFKQSRYSFSGNTKSFGGKPCDIRRFFYQIWECSRRLKDVLVENRDFEDAIRQYDREDAFIYCDPPYYQAECYAVEFPNMSLMDVSLAVGIENQSYFSRVFRDRTGVSPRQYRERAD